MLPTIQKTTPLPGFPQPMRDTHSTAAMTTHSRPLVKTSDRESSDASLVGAPQEGPQPVVLGAPYGDLMPTALPD